MLAHVKMARHLDCDNLARHNVCMTVASAILDDVAARKAPVDGSMMRALRVSLGMTQQDLAARLQVSLRSITRWEIGHVDRLTWRGVLSTLELPPDWEPPADPPAP